MKGNRVLRPRCRRKNTRKALTEYFCHPGDKAVVDKAFEAIGNGHSYTYEARMKAGDQAYTWRRLNVAPVMESDVPAKMVGIISNIQLTREKTGQPEDGRSIRIPIRSC